MSVSYFILYRGKSTDSERFHAHYTNVHVPILLRFPGARSVTTHAPIHWTDPKGVHVGEFELIAQIEFDNLPSLNAALVSAERTLARVDMDTNFPDFSGTVWHQATQNERHLP